MLLGVSYLHVNEHHVAHLLGKYKYSQILVVALPSKLLLPVEDLDPI